MRYKPAILSVSIAIALAHPARAETHYVTVVNAGSAPISGIAFSPAGTPPGPNRLQSTVPPAATARIAYSTGCQIDVVVTYADGGSERQGGIDACTDPRVVFGPGATPGTAPPPAATVAAAPAAAASSATPPAAALAVKAPRWDGKVISKHLGLDGWVDN